MELSYNYAVINVEGNLITCSYRIPMAERHWQITLSDNDICYAAEKKEIHFPTSNIQEFQFEMESGGGRYGDFPVCTAYAILKDNMNPQQLFRIAVTEDYTLLNETKAYDFCDQILKFIGERYQIPTVYKLSIDTRQKRNRVPLALLYLFFVFVFFWLIIHFNLFRKP